MVLSEGISVKQRIKFVENKCKFQDFKFQSKFQELFYKEAVRNHPSKNF